MKTNRVVIASYIISVVIIGFFVSLTFYWKTYFVSKEIEKTNQKIEKIVYNGIKEKIKSDEMPVIKVNFEMVNDSQKISLSKNDIERIETTITNKLIERYKTLDSISFNSMQPVIIFPEKNRMTGNYILKQKDIDDIQGHIKYLTEKTDIAVREVKDELDRDIERLNTWTSIWIGILGIFGAFIPIYFGFSTQKQTDDKFNSIKQDLTATEKKIEGELSKVEEALTKSGSAATTATNAEKMSNQAQEEIKQVQEQTQKQAELLAKANVSAEEALSLANEAKKESKDASKESNNAIKVSIKTQTLFELYKALSGFNFNGREFNAIVTDQKLLLKYFGRVFVDIRSSLGRLQLLTGEDILLNGYMKELYWNCNEVYRCLQERESLTLLDAIKTTLMKLSVDKIDDKDEMFKKLIDQIDLLIKKLNKE